MHIYVSMCVCMYNMHIMYIRYIMCMYVCMYNKYNMYIRYIICIYVCTCIICIICI